MSRLEIEYVSTPAGLQGLLDAIHATDVLALDTEFIGETTYEPVLCLVQVATDAGIWVLDPLAVRDLEPFWTAVTAPEREMVAVAAREEIRFCLRYAGRVPARLLDLQLAAGLVGYSYPLSHTNLLRAVLGVAVSGRETFTDWKQRPLSAQQIEYAADDVRHLLALRERLLADAERLGRTAWVEGECRQLSRKVAEAEQEERWWKVSGGAGLRRRELGVLRELWRWRDAEARAANSPPRRILKDEMLVEIAKRRPATVADLLALRGLDRGAVRNAGPAIVRAVETALKLTDDELPPLRRRDDPRQVGVLSQILSVAANSLAAEHDVDPALLATTSDLQDLVRWRLGVGESEARPVILEGWRGDILGKPLLDVLDGKRHLRVGNLRSANPLVFEETAPE